MSDKYADLRRSRGSRVRIGRAAAAAPVLFLVADGVHGVADAQLTESPVRPSGRLAAAALEVGGGVDAEEVPRARAALHEVLDEVLNRGQLLAARG